MNNVILRSGKAIGLESSSVAVPLGVEYEQLMRNIEKKDDRHGIDDQRRCKNTIIDKICLDNSTDDKKTFLLTPGTNDPGFDAPNTKPAYPQTTIPSSQGTAWIGK